MSPTTPAPSPPETQKSTDKPLAAPKIVEQAFPYSVYLGAYKTLARAKVAVSLYQEQGISPYWVKVDLGSKGTWYRIFTGHFRNADEAQDFIDEREPEEASVKRTKYCALIGVYSSRDAIKKQSEALLKLGHSAYEVEGVDGMSQLYTGAFYTKAGAEKLSEELAAKGIPNQVVER
jgi:cell division septation protein DedD